MSERLLYTKNIAKTFPGVKALSDISFDLYQGEVHCIVGENGAGKSTFIKILSGALKPDSGEIYIDDRRFSFLDPYLAQSLGVQVIYQENILVPQMSVAENVFVGREKTGRFGIIDYKGMQQYTKEIIDFLGIDLDATSTVENLGVADQQFVKLIKAMAMDPKILIMDEPTTMFNTKDTETILKLVKDISQKGIGVIYISHRLKEITRIADRITVLRDGKTVSCYENGDGVDLNMITRDMVGRSVDVFYRKEKSDIGEEVLRVEGLKLDEDSRPIDFSLKRGEILGIAGMVGAGRTEIVRAIFGADNIFSGSIFYKGKKIQIKNPKQAIETGIGFITEDRQKTGLALGLSVVKNMTIAGLDKFSGGLINLKQETENAQKYVDMLDIKTPSLEQEVRFLSGGNQQKVVLARWLFKDVDVFIFDEPTRGIDVNSKAEIYKLMSELTKEGKSIIMVSSDMPELIAMSDRVIVVNNGEISDAVAGDDITEENILCSAIGVNGNEQVKNNI
ncbi:MAG: sugar ABC transporter ATP-binding protein [Clostridia bacterium]|nr:sugar ABC transporter ATP-binding protein [Clostridia bacterium]